MFRRRLHTLYQIRLFTYAKSNFCLRLISYISRRMIIYLNVWTQLIFQFLLNMLQVIWLVLLLLTKINNWLFEIVSFLKFIPDFFPKHIENLLKLSCELCNANFSVSGHIWLLNTHIKISLFILIAASYIYRTMIRW